GGVRTGLGGMRSGGGGRRGVTSANEPSSPGEPPTVLDVAVSMWNGPFRNGATHPSPQDDVTAEDSPPADTAELPPPPADAVGSLSGPHRQYAKNVAHVGVQVAEALECAAAQGILHRDAKPSNLLL